jgi:hypothetical protein
VTHLAKKRRWSSALPAELPAAGLPGSRGGQALASKSEQALATSAVTAGALVVWQPSTTAPIKRCVLAATGFIRPSQEAGHGITTASPGRLAVAGLGSLGLSWALLGLPTGTFSLAVAIEPSLRPQSPENGNILENCRRLSAIWLANITRD